MLPAKIKPKRSGILRAPEREWKKHRRFVRGHQCAATLTGRGDPCEGRVIFAHVRSAANSGKGLKPFDWFGVALCWSHHEEQHDHGAETFMRKYGIDLWKLAAEFAAKSTDLAMKEAMRNA